MKHISTRRTVTATAGILAIAAAACGAPAEETLPGDSGPIGQDAPAAEGLAVDREPAPGERRFASLRQLTFEGENAEAYFSGDGERLIFQRRHEGELECDQIFTIGIDGSDRTLVSTGLGRTTCSYFFPNRDRIVYSSTHLHGEGCPPPPDFSRGYVWALYNFDIFVANADGSEPEVLFAIINMASFVAGFGSEPEVLFATDGYDAEATISRDGSRIVFTSTRDGDLDIYSMNADGSDVIKLTDEPGYDGGPFFSPDGTKIVYRARYPESEEELADYQALLAQNLVRPGVLDIYVMNADGTGRTRLTDNGAANFAPYFHPSGEKVIFASNMNDTGSRNFDLFMVNLDGSGLEQVTFTEEFESFPQFSPDGRYLVFGSNRHGSHEGNTNLFIAEWIDDLP